jgi:hypothetical protein
MANKLVAAFSAAVAMAASALAAGVTLQEPGPRVPLLSVGVVKVQSGASDWIGLRNGVEVAFLGAGETKAGAQRALFANFASKDPALVKQPAKVIDAADELFGRFVLLTAEQNGFSRVVVNVKKGDVKSGGATTPVYEDFVYIRGANTVWLRQAGNEKWKVAQNPKFEAPPVQVLTIPGIGKIEVEAIAEINPPNNARRAIGIDIRTDTPNKNQLQKYREIRATWLEADRATLQQRGYDLVAFQNFTAKRLGRFQVREMSFVQIQREQGKGWPDMPLLPPNKRSKPPLTAEAPAIDPEILTAAIGKAFQIAPGGLADPAATVVANLELVEDVAIASLAPVDAELNAKAFKVSAPAR